MRNKSFLESEAKLTKYETSKFVVIPCPHEKTTSYGKGTKNGPQAILTSSQIVENFDEELHVETYKAGIHTLPTTQISKLGSTCENVVKDKKIPIILGGEHSLSPLSVKAAKKAYPDLSVLQFDAHADLRDKYQGTKQSHACAARRILEICPIVQVGIRNISKEEWDFVNKTRQIEKLHVTPHLNAVPTGRQAGNIVAQLSQHVYITFDVDVFDPSIMPSTGTPEPGGMLWDDVLNIFREVCREKTIVGADFVELMPIKGLSAPNYTVAKLIYRMMGYISRSEGEA